MILSKHLMSCEKCGVIFNRPINMVQYNHAERHAKFHGRTVAYAFGYNLAHKE